LRIKTGRGWVRAVRRYRPIFPSEAAIRRIPDECTFINQRGAVGIRLKPGRRAKWLCF